MQKCMRLLLAIIIASSSAFFISMGKAEVVEAKHCKLGGFHDYNQGGDCEIIFDKQKKDGEVITNVDKKVTEMRSYVLVFTSILIATSVALGALGIVYAGYLYIVSAGEPYKVQEAKIWLTRVGIGVLVVASAYAIFNLMKVLTGF